MKRWKVEMWTGSQWVQVCRAANRGNGIFSLWKMSANGKARYRLVSPEGKVVETVGTYIKSGDK